MYRKIKPFCCFVFFPLGVKFSAILVKYSWWATFLTPQTLNSNSTFLWTLPSNRNVSGNQKVIIIIIINATMTDFLPPNFLNILTETKIKHVGWNDFAQMFGTLCCNWIVQFGVRQAPRSLLQKVRDCDFCFHYLIPTFLGVLPFLKQGVSFSRWSEHSRRFSSV